MTHDLLPQASRKWDVSTILKHGSKTISIIGHQNVISDKLRILGIQYSCGNEIRVSKKLRLNYQLFTLKSGNFF